MLDNGVISQAEVDEDVLTFDVSDETLERAAGAEQNAFPTWQYHCTNGWYNCGQPVAF
jgi:hypothetical protein